MIEVLNLFMKYNNERNKRNNGEVLTPVWLIEEMIESIPKKLFKNKDIKILDPCVGTGNFLFVLTNFLMKCLKGDIKDEKERREHILNNILHGCDICPVNVVLSKKITGVKNIYTKDFLDKKSFEGMTFDIVIGNPPYQSSAEKMCLSKPLYNHFAIKAMKISDKHIFVIPSKWLVGGKGLDNFRDKMVEDHKLVFIKSYENSSNVFENVNISGGVMYYLYDNNYDNKGRVIVNGDTKEVRSYDILNKKSKFTNDIINKIKNVCKDKNIDFLSCITLSTSLSGIETNDKRITKERIEGSVECYINDGSIEYINKMYVNKNFNFNTWKLICKRVVWDKNSGFGKFIICGPNQVYNTSYVGFEVNSSKEVENLKYLLQTHFCNFLMKIKKISNINKGVCSLIPLMNLNVKWTDEMLFDFFNITKDEIIFLCK